MNGYYYRCLSNRCGYGLIVVSQLWKEREVECGLCKSKARYIDNYEVKINNEVNKLVRVNVSSPIV